MSRFWQAEPVGPAIRATGICSMPVYHALAGHGNFAEVLVCNGGHVKNVPGRKTDLADADWLVHLLECGLLAGSFIPPAEIKAARDVLRYRTKVVQSRTSEVQRLGNVLQDAGFSELEMIKVFPGQTGFRAGWRERRPGW
jgi:transposase